MFPVLPFGPVTVPTGPVVLLIAVTIGLELAGRYGRRLGLSIDDVWNTGLLAILGGLILARLWNVIQFWPIYLAEPWLMISIRPSGFALIPGLAAGVVTAFGYFVARALDPRPMVAALLMGATTALAIIQAGMLLTGELLGTLSDVPWAINYYGELRHPVALYYAIGLSMLVYVLWILPVPSLPGRIILMLCLGIGLVYLAGGAFEYNPRLIAGLRFKQLGGLILALFAAIRLSQSSHMQIN
ncbi:MAG: prolipoprotein diacylglyceryl transferase [Caldilineaceae bacterium]|nr:prolipoprotein diacylglyceryl transferase [Caldilineaceae bacterium]